MKQVVPTIEVFAEPEDIPVRGFAMASGDDALDREVENEIMARVSAGNVWAWAIIEVRASYGGVSASDYLGCCSYKSEVDFISARDYYPDMVKEATRRLAEKVAALQGVEILCPHMERTCGEATPPEEGLQE